MKRLVILLVSVASLGTQAAERPESQLVRMAREAIGSQYLPRSAKMEPGDPACLLSRPQLAVYGYAEGGFAVVSKSDLLPGVLGYSGNSFDEAEANENFLWWLNATSKAADYCVSHGLELAQTAPNQAQYPMHVLPLMSSAWGQEEPFFDDCPLVYNSEREPVHSLVGCVATALSQIFYYHKAAGTPRGSATVGVPYDRPSQYYTVDFSALDYDWDNMRDTYSIGNYTPQQAHAVAELCYTVGVACEMMYDYTASGAMTERAALALKRNFSLPETCRMVVRDEYAEDNRGWMNLIYNELANDRPLFYTGSDFPAGGHAFVFDGYDEQGRVHVNWGWYGRQDGYFSIDLLNPGSYNFRVSQDMIIGIQPKAVPQLSSQTVEVQQAGSLASLLTDVEGLGSLTLTGEIDESDFAALRQCRALQTLDMRQVRLATEGEALPRQALYGCASLRQLVLPQTVHAWGDGALAGCSNLNMLELPQEADGQFVIRDEVVYNADGSELIAVLPTCVGSVEVEPTVSKIHDFALEGCKRVRIVYLPQSVKMLGDRALADVAVLRELHVAAAEPPATGVQTFSGVDAGFMHLYIPAGLREEYRHAAGWSQLFASGNVSEEGTTIKARNAVRRVGEANPIWAYEVWGDNFFGGEPELTCEATADSPAGLYRICVSLGTVNARNVTCCDGWLVVEAADAQAAESADAAGIECPVSEIKREVGRFGLQGTAVLRQQQGVQLVRYNDGSSHKYLIR